MGLDDVMRRGLSDWMKEGGPDSDVVLSSRVRLARNLADLPFSPLMTESYTERLMEYMQKAISDDSFQKLGAYQLVRLKDLQPLERKILVEKHLISPKLSDDYAITGVIFKDDESTNIMINEEDHLRIQCIAPGLQLRTAYEMASQIDDALEGSVSYAFDEKLGYLTSCLTNVGTGLRASVMVHIPALVITGQIPRLVSAIQRVGLVVRGYYGEGSESVGNIFQISNQLTLGFSEEEIVENLQDVIRQIIGHERDARQDLLNHSKMHLEDKVYRSLGILSHARLISSQETMERISDVRLGIDLGMLKGVSANILNELMILTGEGYLQQYAGRELAPEERDVKRACLIRERLKEYEIK